MSVMLFRKAILRKLHLSPPPLPLSDEVRRRLERLFPPETRSDAQRLLEEEMGNNLFFGPFVSYRKLLPPTSPAVQQVRCAAMKLSGGDLDALRHLVAQFDGDVVELVSASGLIGNSWAHWLPPEQPERKP